MPGQGMAGRAEPIPRYSVAANALEAVLVLDGRTFDETEHEHMRSVGLPTGGAALPANGFSKIATLNTMTLWQTAIVDKNAQARNSVTGAISDPLRGFRSVSDGGPTQGRRSKVYPKRNPTGGAIRDR